MLNFSLKIRILLAISSTFQLQKTETSCFSIPLFKFLLLLSLFQLSLLFPVSKEYFSSHTNSTVHPTHNRQGSSFLAAVNEKPAQSSEVATPADSAQVSASTSPVPADTTTQAPTQASAESTGPSFLLLWIRLIVVLAIFAVLAYVVYRFVLKRYKLSAKQSPLFHPIAEFSLTVNKQLRIVRIVQQYYILAISQDSVTLLASLDDKETIDELRIFEESVPSFAEKTDFFIDIFKRKGGKDVPMPRALDITRNLHERLKSKQL